MKNIKYLGGEWKYLKKKRESLQNLLVPSSIIKSHLEFFIPYETFSGRSSRRGPHNSFLTIPSLLSPSLLTQQKETEGEKISWWRETRISSIDLPVLRSISVPRHFWIINPLITTREREEEGGGKGIGIKFRVNESSRTAASRYPPPLPLPSTRPSPHTGAQPPHTYRLLIEYTSGPNFNNINSDAYIKRRG